MCERVHVCVCVCVHGVLLMWWISGPHHETDIQ